MYHYIYYACPSDLKQAPGLMGVLSAVAHDILFTTDPTILAMIYEHDKLAGMTGYKCTYLCINCDEYCVDVCVFAY